MSQEMLAAAHKWVWWQRDMVRLCSVRHAGADSLACKLLHCCVSCVQVRWVRQAMRCLPKDVIPVCLSPRRLRRTYLPQLHGAANLPYILSTWLSSQLSCPIHSPPLLFYRCSTPRRVYPPMFAQTCEGFLWPYVEYPIRCRPAFPQARVPAHVRFQRLVQPVGGHSHGAAPPDAVLPRGQGRPQHAAQGGAARRLVRCGGVGYRPIGPQLRTRIYVLALRRRDATKMCTAANWLQARLRTTASSPLRADKGR